VYFILWARPANIFSVSHIKIRSSWTVYPNRENAWQAMKSFSNSEDYFSKFSFVQGNFLDCLVTVSFLLVSIHGCLIDILLSYYFGLLSNMHAFLCSHCNVSRYDGLLLCKYYTTECIIQCRYCSVTEISFECLDC
jgi:hypothetical protein